MVYSFGGAPYAFGLFAHVMNGLILALMYARWQWLVPGRSPWAHGVAIGVATTLAAQLVVGPLVGPGGFPWTRPHPIPGLLTSLIAHLAFGLVLALGYSRLGEATSADGG
jgi:hypothetical protein